MQGYTATVQYRIIQKGAVKEIRTEEETGRKKEKISIPLSSPACSHYLIYLGGFLSSARESRKDAPSYFKYYKNIEVKSGDTLHSLAEKYNEPSVSSDRVYISEIRKLNDMKSSGLIPGSH